MEKLKTNGHSSPTKEKGQITLENCVSYALSDEPLDRRKVTETIEHLRSALIIEKNKTATMKKIME